MQCTNTAEILATVLTRDICPAAPSSRDSDMKRKLEKFGRKERERK
jgi:hypothetical protein